MRPLIPAVIAIATLAAFTAQSPTARACGGFFCNAVTPTPIVQAGERVLFAPHDGLVTMHIEIVYQGDPTQFGWILPLADLPMDAAGRPLPLDKAVEISSQQLFITLQSLTDPSFQLNRVPDDDTQCPMPTFADSASQDAASGELSDPNSPPGVVVLEEAAVGPYDAQLIDATSSEALYEWLGDNGYIQDPKAQPILDGYLRKGFKFLGIKLQSGKDTGDLRPLAITLGENAPCVPLVLTQIAATPDMPILVFVLGGARAIPKNFIHAVIDERAFGWPGAPTYQASLSQALIDAGRRAWVTEFAGSSEPFRGQLLASGVSTAGLRNATDLVAALQEISNIGIFPSDPDLTVALRSAVPMPEGLSGYPFGNCQYCQGCSWAEESCEQQGLPNDDHLTTEAEFYGFISYWASLDRDGVIDLGLDMQAFAQAIEDEVITPRRNIETLLANASTLTRFFTLIDPDDMTRDPVFAFNPDLPMVSNVHTATWDLVDCDSNTARVTYADGTAVTTDCGFSCGFGFAQIQPLEGTKPLLYPEVLDETGDPIRFSTEQVDEVDRLLGSAEPGIPSLPPTFDPQPPAIVTPTGTVKSGGDGCTTGTFGLVGLLALLLIRARPSKLGRYIGTIKRS